jgi:hypothetical protein
MSSILEHAIERLRQMPEERQDRLARLVLHEIEEEERWIQSTATHENKLPGLIRSILAADDRGECDPLEVDKL